MYKTETIPNFGAGTAVKPERLARQPWITLTELAGCMLIATTCVDMWLGVFTLVRCGIYIVAVLMAFAGSGFRPRFTAVGGLFFLTGGLYILKALLYPPVPILVRNDIRNVLVAFAVLATFGISDLTAEAWERFQFKAHRTMLLVSTVGALLGLAKLLYYNQGGVFPSLMDPERGYPLGTSLTMDYNFYALPLLLGLFSAFWLIKRDIGAVWRTAALVSLPLLIPAVLLSGSRRGFVVLICAVPILTAWLFFGRRETRFTKPGLGVFSKIALTVAGCLILFSLVKLETVTQTLQDVASADSLSDVLKRWETFQEGTYSESRVHYWAITLQRLSRFGPLDYLFGEGFGYVTDLGADPDLVEDYPHNFLLSSMLYGGILQTTLLVALVWIALAGLGFRRPGRSMFGAWFALIIFFLLTSCNSFFSSEIAIFLTVIGLGLKQFHLPVSDAKVV